MKEKYVTQLQTDEEITTYFMVKSVTLKKGSNKKTYLDLLLCDCTGEINGKKWDIADEEVEGLKRIESGKQIKVKATVTEWNGMKQLRISKIRLTGAEDNLEMSDFVKSAPENPNTMYEFIHAKAEAFEDVQLQKLCVRFLDDYREKLMYYPAAVKNHHAERSGLLWHIKRMLMTAERVCEVYTNLNRELLMAGVILHDIQKMNEIESNESGISTGYLFEGKMLGHLVMGAREVEKMCKELKVDEEKTIMLQHMMISHHLEPEWGSPIRPLFAEAEMLHYIDIIDAKMYDMEEAVSKTGPGEFSDRVWTLDNRTIYRAKQG